MVTRPRPGGMRGDRRGIRKDRRGITSVFDSVLAFTILVSASVLIFLIPLSQVAHNEALTASRQRDGFADDTLEAVLKSTLDAASYSKDGSAYELRGMEVRRAVQLYMELSHAASLGAKCDLAALKGAIVGAFDAALSGFYDYSLDLTYSTPAKSISEELTGRARPAVDSSASGYEVGLGEARLLVVLTIWEP